MNTNGKQLAVWGAILQCGLLIGIGSNNAPKLDTVARYEAHIRRNIEQDFKILAGMAIAKTNGLGSSFMQSETG